MKAACFYYVPPGFDEAIRRHPDEHVGIVHQGTVNLDAFARALAKIAWCHTVALGHHVEIEPLPIREMIRGQNNLGPFLVGSDPTDGSAPESDLTKMHQVKITWDNYPKVSSLTYLVCHIRLFANAGTATNGMPTFTVFVGTRLIG
jgi:hypothetical protein